MSEELSYDDILDKLPAYTLGALEPDEMLAVDAYVRKHEELLMHLEQSEQVTAQLAHLAPDIPLPVKNKQALMQRVRADLAAQPAAPAEPERTSEPRPQRGAAETTRTDSWLANLWQSIGPGRGWAIATGMAVLVLLIVGLYAVQLQGRLRRVETEVTRLQMTNAELQTANDQLQQNYQILQQQLQSEQDRLAFIANTPPERTISIPGTDEAPQASGQLFVGSDNQALLALRDLTPLTSEQTYQLWLIPADEAPVPAGLLAVEPNSPTWLTVQIPPEAENFAAVGISIEPAGGSPAPTGPIVLLGPVS